ncbi:MULTISPECIES: relaxase/mobilization nuclease domain-containing protein [unclassified Acinetobacter]|uniref:relaxase/mobilization nuclease domain-containing protein n=1 Tax=unclassified Acinetobacter TaxID=196816 RepID=UPI0015D1B635|nr:MULTISPECIES: relaxase/mobilization nuclease domain-containing protein [unclassified Acinetobacter]
MYFKFLENGVGDPARAASYLIDDKDHQNRPRAGVQVLRGDPSTFAVLAKSSPHKYKYTSVVIAWAEEDKLSDQDISEVLDAFEQHAFVGLEPHQYHMTAVMHVEDNGAKHVHILVPRIELTSGKSLNIAPPGHRHYFDPLRDYFNYRNNWARPDDPARSRDSKLPNHIYFENAAAMRAGLKGETQKHRIQLIDQFILHRILSGVVTNRESIIQSLKEIGEVTTVGKDYITLKTDDRRQRLKSDFYHEQFSIQNYLQDRNRTTGAQRTREQIAEDLERDRKKANQCFEQVGRVRAKREHYNKQHYPDISAVSTFDESTVPEFTRGTENSSSSRRQYQSAECSSQRNEYDQFTQSRSDNGSGSGEGRARDLYQQTAEVNQPNGSEASQAKQCLGRKDHLDSIRQHTYSSANATFKNTEWALLNEPHFAFNSYPLEISHDHDRIRTTESGVFKSTTDPNRTIETAATNASEYRRQLKEDCGNTEALSNSIRRENSAIRNRIEAQQVNTQQLRAGTQKGVALTRSKHFFSRLKTSIITTLKSLFESSRNYRTDQTTGRNQSESTSTESQSFGLSRLVSFAKQRSTRRSLIRSNIEGFGWYENDIKRIDANLQNTCRLIKRYKFPVYSLDHYLRLIYESNERAHLSESIEIASQADRDMRKFIQEIQKEPYGAYAKKGLNIDYSRAIKKCVKDMVDQIQYIRPEDYQNMDGFIKTVKCYTEMLEFSLPDVERIPNYFHVDEMIQTSIKKLEDRILQITEEPDSSTTEPIRLNSMHQTLDRRQQSDKSNESESWLSQ